MSDMQNFSDNELQAELNSRKEVQRQADKPCMIEVPDYKALRGLCQKYIDDLHEKNWVDDDLKHYVFETAMTTFFGPNVWGWINKQN